MAKKNARTKLVSLMASLALVVGLMPLPAPAFADDGAPDTGNQNAAPPLTAGTIDGVETPFTIGAQGTDDTVQVSTWDGLQNAVDNASNGKVIQLIGNVVNPGGKDRIQVNKSVTIDLNGFTLNRNLRSVTDNGHVIEVFNGATLTIQDTSASGGGKITGGYSDCGGGIYVNYNATLNISGGAITDNNAKKCGGGIYLKGSLSMTGGAVSRNWAGEQGGGIYARQKNNSTIQDCSISNNEADGHGGGIYMDAKDKKLTIANAHIDANRSGDDGGGFFLHWGTIEMNGGTISGNEAANDSGGGKVTSQTTLTANDVLIKNNKAKTKEGGGIKNFGTATLTNCRIISNSAQKQGGGIFNDNDENSDKSLGDMTLNNCTIAGNSSGHDGGGVYSDKKLKIVGGTIGASTVDDVSIAGNYATNRGDGVFIGKDSEVAAIEGALKIKDNSTAEHGQDLFLRTGQKITLSGALSSGAQIWVMAEDGVGVFTIDYKAKNPDAEPSTYFVSTEGVDIVLDGNEAKIASSWSDLQTLIDRTPEGGTLPLDQNYTASSKNDRLQVRKNITIDLNGHTVNRNLKEKKSNGHVFEVFGGATLTIQDSSAQNGSPGTGKITGGWPDRGGGIYVNKNASLTIESGSISGNHSAKAGGGIYVLGNLTMTGGSVERNQAGEAGGGIFAGAESAISLNGAVITGNEADGDGGGINVRSQHGSSIENCQITGNHADNGGGVCMLAEGKTLTIRDTVIDNNTADADGGGLVLMGTPTTVNMNGGSISDNKAGSDGGGAKVNAFTTFNATNVEIARNEAEDDEGGGVKTHGTTVLENCRIISNSAQKQGGGVFNDKYDTPIAGSIGEADLTIEGCTIAGNSSGHDGGGVYSSRKLAIVGGTIGASTVGGQEIPGNSAAGNGGGIFIGKNAADVRISGCITATGNNAVQGKDLYLRSGKKLALGASISGTNIGYIDMEQAGIFTKDYSKYQTNVAPGTLFGTGENAIPVAWSRDDKEAQLKSAWPDLQDQINQAAEDRTEVTLDQDYIADSSDDRLQIPKNKTVTINLNGFTLNRNRASVTDDGHVFEVLDGATLTIKDESDAKTGTITGGYSKWGGGVFVNAGATLNVLGGTIEGNHASEYGGGIYAKKNSSVNIAGGAIARNKASEDGGGIYMNGVLAMTGGAVEGNVAKESGGGIYVSTDGTIGMSHASIVGNISTESGGGINMHLDAYETTFESCTIARNKSDGSGGGIRMDAGGKLLRIVDTAIEENTSGDDGGGIFLRTGAIEMTGGRISDNTAANDSGGVKVESGTAFEAENATISGNKATTKEGGGIKNYGATKLVGCTIVNNSAVNEGGGIFNNEYDESSQGDLWLENCTISGNSTESNGGGVYSSSWLKIVGGTIGNSTTEAGKEIPGNSAAGKGGGIFIGRDAEVVEIEGDIVARGNSAITFGNDIYLRPGKKLTCTGALSESATMGVDLEDGIGIITKGYKDKNGTAIPADRFIVAKGYSVGLNSNEVEIKSEWAALKSQIENASDGALIELTKDYAAGTSDHRIKIPEGKHITVDLRGYTLNRNRSESDADGHVFEVLGTLTLQDTSASKTGTITGGWANNGGGINIASSGTLNLLGGTIAGNKAVERGGGIYVHGTLNMRGGTIEANKASGSGGGIGMDENAAISLEAGAITGNETDNNGGGIAVSKHTQVNVKGSPVVWGNNATRIGSDMYLPSDIKLNVTSALDESARMGVALQGGWGTFTSGYSDNNNVDPAKYFASTSGYAVYKENGEAALGPSTYGETEYEKPFIEWNSQINDNTDLLGGQNWMSGISGERYLNEINIAGSHDSGMNNIQEIKLPDTDDTSSLATYMNYVDLIPSLGVVGVVVTSILKEAAYKLGRFYAKTQTTNIDQQLAEGARIFDLRLNDCYKKPSGAFDNVYKWADDEENLWICHGANELTGCFLALDSSDDFLSFSEVLGWMKDFLEMHPTETIILNIRPETIQSGHGGKIYNRAREILSKTMTATNPSTGEPYLYKESGSDSFFARYTYMPQLKDCRGKIVLMPNDSWGLSPVGGFTKGMLVENFKFPSDHTLTASEKVVEEQQAYAQLNPDGSARIPAVANAMTDTLWMWELNCTGEDQGTAKYIVSGDSPVDLAGIVNPALVGDGKLFGPEKAGQYIGWVRMDAFRAKYAKPIWVTNFFDDLQYCTVTVKSGLKDPSDPNKTHPNYPDQEYKILKGTQLKVPGNIYKQLAEGTYLDSWKARGADAVVTCNPGDTFTVNEDVVITAQWLNEGNIPVQVVWKDGDDADKLRPHSVEFAVTTVDKESSQDVTSQLTLTDEGCWSGIVEGTVKSVVPNMDWAQGQYQSTEEFEAGAGYTFTFSHTPSATVQVAGEVIWEDDDDAVGARPERVQIRLLVNGQDSRRDPITVTEDNGWQFSFGALPQYVDGEKVQYSIAEGSIEDYDTVIDGFSVTNTYVPSGKNLVDVYGFVNWNDGDNRNGERPESITVRLFANGVAAGVREVGEGEFGLWLFSFEDLPIRDGAEQKITYTISVDEIAKYESEVAPSGDYAFRITNTLVVLPEEKTPAEVDAAPDPYNLTYNGEERSLVKAGAASGGTMMYALGTNATTEPAASDYSSDLPAGSDVGNYPVWYYVEGNMFHTDTNPECVTASIGKRSATITVDDAEKLQGETDPAITGTVEGLVAEGDLGEVSYYRTNNDEAPGTYEDVLDAKFTANPNYDVNVVKGNFTITSVNAIRWLNGDGSVLQEKTYTEGQAVPTYDGAQPTKAATVQYTYSFASWDKGTVEGSITTYKPVFNETVNEYTVRFVNDDGTDLQSGKVPYGDTPEYTGKTPEKAATAEYTYKFKGWDKEIAAVTGDATYTAAYEATPVPPAPVKQGTLTFDLGGGTIDGKTSLTIEANVGDVITIPQAPVRDGYTFKYWQGSEYYPGDKYTVEGDHTFTAVWEQNAAEKEKEKNEAEKAQEKNAATKAQAQNTTAKGSSAKTGDTFGGVVAALGATAVLAFCLAVFALYRRRRPDEEK